MARVTGGDRDDCLVASLPQRRKRRLLLRWRQARRLRHCLREVGAEYPVALRDQAAERTQVRVDDCPYVLGEASAQAHVAVRLAVEEPSDRPLSRVLGGIEPARGPE